MHYEFEFLGILYNNPILMPEVEVIFNFNAPLSDSRLNLVWNAMKNDYRATGTVSGFSVRRWLKQNNSHVDVNIVTEVARAGNFPERLPQLLAEVQSKMVIRDLGHIARTIDHAQQDPDTHGLQLLDECSGRFRAIEQGLTFDADVTVAQALQRLGEKSESLHAGDINKHFIPTGINSLDKELIGLIPGNTYVIGARPSIGKTALAMSMLRNIDKSGIRCGFLSIEMEVTELIERYLAMECGMTLRNMPNSTKEQLEMYQHAKNNFRTNADFKSVCGRNKRRLSNVMMKARTMKQTYPDMKVMFVDYIQKISPDRKEHSRAIEVGIASSALVDFGKQNNVAMVILAQLKRPPATKEGSRPKLADLKESSDIEQDADVVIFPHRSRDIANNSDIQSAELILGKNRQGPPGIVHCKYAKHKMHFYDDRFEHNEEESAI